jgi:hypothetical protein
MSSKAELAPSDSFSPLEDTRYIPLSIVDRSRLTAEMDSSTVLLRMLFGLRAKERLGCGSSTPWVRYDFALDLRGTKTQIP